MSQVESFKQLGLSRFENFASQDIYIYHDDLQGFLYDMTQLKAHILNNTDEQQASFWSFRIDNTISAIQCAMKLPDGGVYIG